MKHKKIIYNLLAIVMLTFSGCSTRNLNSSPQESPLSRSEKKRVELSKQVAGIVAKISEDSEVRQEIYETIEVISKNPYRDQSFYFIEILQNKHNHYLQKPSKFAKLFYSELKNGDKGFIDEIYSNKLQLYFPYHERFSKAKSYTVSYQDLIDFEQNKDGISYENGRKRKQSVNEKYALSKPTLIIGQFDNSEQKCSAPFSDLARCMPEVQEPVCNENHPDYPYCQGYVGDPNPTAGFPGFLDPLFVNVGKAQSTKHYDGVFAGGSEIRFYATSSTLLGNSANARADVDFLAFFTRSDINKKRWKDVNRIVEHAWYPWEVNCVIGVYEDDNSGLLNNIQNIVLPIEVDIPLIGVISLEAGKQIDNKDEDLGWTKYDRLQFYNTNRPNRDLGNGTYDTWPIYNHGGGLKFTLPIIN